MARDKVIRYMVGDEEKVVVTVSLTWDSSAAVTSKQVARVLGEVAGHGLARFVNEKEKT